MVSCKLTKVIGLFWICLYVEPTQVFAAQSLVEPPSSAKLLTILGANSLKAQQGKTSRELHEGSRVEAGDKIATQDQVAAVIQYKDGSTVTISPNSEFQIEDQVDGT